MSTAVVNVACGHWYPKGTARLIESLAPYGIPCESWINRYPDGCPKHEELPYAFKLYAIEEVAKRYRFLIWADSAYFCTNDPAPLIAHVAEHGYMLLHNGANVGQWCANHALPKLGIDRETAMGIPEIAAGLMAFDTQSPLFRPFMDGYWAAMKAGAFIGPHTNGTPGVTPGFDVGWCSDDSRVKGHRHDQTAASVVAWRLGMSNLVCPPKFMAYDYGDPVSAWRERVRPETIFMSRGM